MGKPKIRFKGYEDAWEQRKLGEIYGSIGNAFVGTATPYYVEQGHFYLESNNVKDGQINHNSEIFINDEFYEKQKDKWLHTGDVVMVQSGHVGHAAVIPKELNNTAAHALIMFRNPKEEIEPYFLNYEYQTDKVKKKIENITTGNTIKHILASDMQEFVVDVPKYEEQKVIASYFSHLDHLITLHQRKCEETKSLKKYMLQKMFPENGKCVPEIRFSGFSDAWEQRKVGNFLTESREVGHKGDVAHKMTVKLWSKGICEKNEAGSSNTQYFIRHTGQFIYSKLDFLNCAFGVVPKNLESFETTADVPAFDCNELNPYFMFYTAIQPAFYKKNGIIADGSRKAKRIHVETFLNMPFFIPNLEEQNKIVDALSSLDHLITLHQHKCDELQKLKKFMLQNMFV